MRARKHSISVFFPCYNDAKSIGRLVLDAQKTLNGLTEDWEIIVVNDGSTDDSLTVLEKLRRRCPRLRIINHLQNKGYGAALRSGFAASSKSLVFYTDGDGQYDAKGLAELLPLMTKNADFINGIKMNRKDPTYRVVIGNWYSFIARWVFWLPIYDVDCDFRLIRRSILKRINLVSNSGAICVELVKKSQCAGARFRQVSVRHYERKFGSSQFFRASRILLTAYELVRIWMGLFLVYPRFAPKK